MALFLIIAAVAVTGLIIYYLVSGKKKVKI